MSYDEMSCTFYLKTILIALTNYPIKEAKENLEYIFCGRWEKQWFFYFFGGEGVNEQSLLSFPAVRIDLILYSGNIHILGTLLLVQEV